MGSRLTDALQVIVGALARSSPDWSDIEQAWLDASLEAAGTEHEQRLRDTGIALQVHDAEGLRWAIESMLAPQK